jgi:hypothetical protein
MTNGLVILASSFVIAPMADFPHQNSRKWKSQELLKPAI